MIDRFWLGDERRKVLPVKPLSSAVLLSVSIPVMRWRARIMIRILKEKGWAYNANGRVLWVTQGYLDIEGIPYTIETPEHGGYLITITGEKS